MKRPDSFDYAHLRKTKKHVLFQKRHHIRNGSMDKSLHSCLTFVSTSVPSFHASAVGAGLGAGRKAVWPRVPSSKTTKLSAKNGRPGDLPRTTQNAFATKSKSMILATSLHQGLEFLDCSKQVLSWATVGSLYRPYDGAGATLSKQPYSSSSRKDLPYHNCTVNHDTISN